MGQAESPLLAMQDIRKAFGPTMALDGVDIEIRAGEVHALVGENGAGKSTLMKILSGAQPPDRGTMHLDDIPFAPRGPLQARESGVSMMYQEGCLAQDLNVRENIFLGLETLRGVTLDQARMKGKAREVMNRCGLDTVCTETPVSALPPAQCQLVEVARAMASGCRVLVMDEPTSSLTRPDVDRLFSLIREWRSEGLAVIYISHFLEEVRAVADICTVLCDGRVVRSAPMSDWTDTRILECMVGRDVSDLYPSRTVTTGDVMMSVRLPEAVIDLRAGEIFGIAGLVGAGRTELVEKLFGLRNYKKGAVEVFGETGNASPSDRWRQGVGFLSEDRKQEGLMLDASVADNLLLPGLKPWTTPAGRSLHAAKWLKPLQITCASPEAPVSSLSGGNQQKVALARLLCQGVEILILDEPARGIDVGAKSELYRELVKRVDTKEEGGPGRAIIMVSSYLPELLGMCDRIAVMRRGHLGTPRPVEEWTEHSLLEEAVA